jgi:hypothetical protein
VSARLTAAFDLSSVREATLSFWTWYDLEADYDFAYVSLSTDGGATWRLLLPDNGTAGDYGPAFNGRSDAVRGQVNGWLREEIALDAFTGQPVLIRFEVLSDGGLSGAGFALDDLAIPEIGYASDVEGGPDGWEAAGFLQTGNILPQLWELRLIDRDTGTVTPLALDANNQLQTTFNLGPNGATLVVVPVTPFVYEATRYWIQIE